MKVVIDTSVAMGPGFANEHAIECADILLAAYRNPDISCVGCSSLQDEWERHAFQVATFAKNFFFNMRAANRWDELDDPPTPTKIDTLPTGTLSPAEQTVANKDYHLVYLAEQTDHRIVSVEDKARRHFAVAAEAVPEWRNIVWIRPCDSPRPSVWLTEGAPFVPERTLGQP